MFNFLGGTNLLFGNMSHCEDNELFIDTVILIRKQYIYASKCLKEVPNLAIGLSKVYEIYIAEHGITLPINKMRFFKRKWIIYELHVPHKMQ